MLESLLIANRGEIARRIIRTARKMGIRTIAVVTEPDRSWPHWREADEAAAVEDYLSIEEIVAAALKSGAGAIHPGYGFLSENPAFAEACEAAGITFVGPAARTIRAMGSKADAKSLMELAGVPVLPGYNGERQDQHFLRQTAYEIGYPVMIKAVAGGGGRGMRRVDLAIDFEAALAAARREAKAAFADDRVLLERCVKDPRHIEAQILADSHGRILHLFERDCSLQRRHQKVIEEAPAPGLSGEMRAALGEAAIVAARAVGYLGAGTVEFVADGSEGVKAGSVFFIEMNTRLQVEHPVSEAVTGLDLVEWQLRIAAGESLPFDQEAIPLNGHAVEARIYAEDPADGFRPSGGRLWAASFPTGEGVRVDAGAETGAVISPFYDAMLAKVIASGADRAEALQRLSDALAQIRIAGPKTNLAFLKAVAAHPDFVAGAVHTGFAEAKLEELAGAPLDPALAGGAVSEWMARENRRLARAAPGPWARSEGFELGGLTRSSSLALEIDGQPVPVSLAWSRAGPKVVSIDGKPVALSDAEIVWGAREAFVLADGGQLHVVFPDVLERGETDAVSDGAVVAPITGRVTAVSVAPGARVKKGDQLFTVEAMKMEHTVLAPLAGIVGTVRVTAGKPVDRNAVAVVIEQATEEKNPDTTEA